MLLRQISINGGCVLDREEVSCNPAFDLKSISIDLTQGRRKSRSNSSSVQPEDEAYRCG